MSVSPKIISSASRRDHPIRPGPVASSNLSYAYLIKLVNFTNVQVLDNRQRRPSHLNRSLAPVNRCSINNTLRSYENILI